MTESEYIIVTDRVKLSNALACLRDIVPNNNEHIDNKKFRDAYLILRDMEIALFAVTELEEG
jgi:hypothetical protein